MWERVYWQAEAFVETRETRTLQRSSPLRSQVAGLAAAQAVVLAIVAKADVVPALAQDAEAFALTLFLFQVALCADEGHA